MEARTLTTDKAGKLYWDDLWSASPIPEPIDPRISGPRNEASRRLHAYFSGAFTGHPTSDMRLLEVGCARSAWLPYFGREFGFQVTGLDYSELGCQQERDILARTGVDGEIVCADLFAPPEDLEDRFDVVVSFGVVEHFSDTAACTRALARLTRPGGLVITVIPNMTGLIGVVERLINPAVAAIHVPLTPAQLAAAHSTAVLDVMRSEYFLATGFGVLNLNGLDPRARSTRLKAVARAHLSRLSKATWALESRTRPLPASRALSPYVVCRARRAIDRGS